MSIEQSTRQKTRLALIAGVLVFFGGVAILAAVVYSQKTPSTPKSTGVLVSPDSGLPPSIFDGSHGSHHALVIMTYSTGTTVPTNPSIAQEQALMNQVAAYFDEASYHQMTIHGVLNPTQGADVVGWVPLPTGVCDQTCMMAQARTVNPSLDFTKYSWIILVAASGNTGGEGGSAAGNFGSILTPDGYVKMGVVTVFAGIGTKGGPGVTVHEMGHIMGLGHDAYVYCQTAVYFTTGAPCTRTEYGDSYDAMGAGSVNGVAGPFSAPFKEVVKWFVPTDEVVMNGAATDMQYDLADYETAGTTLKVLKIQKSQNEYAYLEFRQPTGFDTFPDNGQGVLIHYRTSAYGTFNIDPTPAFSGRFLKPGESYSSPSDGFTVKFESITNPTGPVANRRARLHVTRLVAKDFTPPVVSISAPTTGTTVSGQTTVTAQATDPSGISKVIFSCSACASVTSTSAPYHMDLNTVAMPNGTASVVATAYDTLGNVASSAPVSLTVNNPDTTPPSVFLFGPTNNSTITDGPIIFQGTTYDNGTGVTKVEAYDGTMLLGTATASNGGTFPSKPAALTTWSFNWNVATVPLTTIPNSTIAFTAKAYDAAGHVTVSTPLNLTLNVDRVVAR